MKYHEIPSKITLVDRVGVSDRTKNVYWKMAEKELKMFYVVDGENIPAQFEKHISLDRLSTVEKDGEKYLPIFIGSAEAKMMIDENLFQKEGDTIKDLFGNDIVIAGILPETGTILDNLHFVSDDFEISK